MAISIDFKKTTYGIKVLSAGQTIISIHELDVGGIKSLKHNNKELLVVCGDSKIRTFCLSSGKLLSECGTNLSEQERETKKANKKMRKRQFLSRQENEK